MLLRADDRVLDAAKLRVGDSVVVTVTGRSARKAGSARFAIDLIACSLLPSDDTIGPLRYRN